MTKPLALQADERQAIEATRRFANLPRIESDAEVERLFRDLVDFRESTPTWVDAKTGRERRAVTLTAMYGDIHSVVRGWFARVRSISRRRDLSVEINRALDSVDAGLILRGGRLEYTHRFLSVFAVCAFATALIIDERRGLASRLQKCGWCGRFNLDLDPRGRPRRFCSPEHKARADLKTVAERVRKHRAEADLEVKGR